MSRSKQDYLAALTTWGQALERLTEEPIEYLYAFSKVLNEMGLEVGLATICARTPHPQLDMLAIRWRPLSTAEVPTESTTSILKQQTYKRSDGVLDIYPMRHGHTDEATWRKSPFYHVLSKRTSLQIRLVPPPPRIRFPIVKDLVERGMTDYLALPFQSRREVSMAMSLATTRPGGFPSEFVEAFQESVPLLSLSLAYKAETIQFEQVLTAYLGREPAALVLAGQIRRGDLVAREAAIGFVDLRGFTAASQRLTSEELLTRMSTFFECVHRAVASAGGEIIKFLGDGVLFIVADDGDARLTCDRALGVVRKLTRTIAEHNSAAQDDPLRFGCGLHFGEVLYGNIGSPARLDFTVIGPTVNLTSRLESLTGQLGEVCLISERLASLTSLPHRIVGEFDLKGIKGKSVVYAPVVEGES